MKLILLVILSGKRENPPHTPSLIDDNSIYRQYRRSCLKALNTNLYEELDYLDNFAEENPKNYQLWYHRRAIIELLKDPSRELSFTETVFEIDAKNYHAWCHRQWVLKTFHLFDQELLFIDKCLEKDIRNNSAWNQVSNDHLFRFSFLLKSYSLWLGV